MNRSTLTAFTLIVSLTAGAPLLDAQPRERAREARPARPFAAFAQIEHLAEKLQLTDEQVNSIRAIYRDLHDQNAPHRKELRTGRATAFQALLANPNDLAAAQAVADRRAQAEAAITTNALKATSSVLKVLAPEQRAELAQLTEERRERRRER